MRSSCVILCSLTLTLSAWNPHQHAQKALLSSSHGGPKNGTTNERAEDVGATSNYVARYRAAETASENPLIRDPYAEKLAGSCTRGSVSRCHLDPFRQDFFAVRTKVFDDFVDSSVAEKAIPQVVIVGAGQDTRAYRLESLSKDVRVFELDFPQLLQEKAALLDDVEAIATRVEVPCDLAVGTWTDFLKAKGFRSDVRSAWVIEGVTGYLTKEVNDQLFAAIRDMSPAGSSVMATFIGENSGFANPIHKFLTDSPDAFVEGFGYSIDSAKDMRTYAKTFKRGDREGWEEPVGYKVITAIVQ